MRRLLIANRGEIACRIMRTARRMGIATVAVYSDADAEALHVRTADAAVHLGPAEAAQSYLSIEKVIAAARSAGADAIHPGYGFLSENADFARACAAAGITFVGPPASAIGAMGGKREAKAHVAKLGVPSLPWVTAKEDKDLIAEAAKIGFPLMIKASAGGGGRGLRRVGDVAQLTTELPRARSESLRAFGDDTIILERALDDARHVEIQIMADTHGTVLHLGERDCSLQRRHQKVIEESPAVDADLRAAMGVAAVTAAKSIGYVGAGTVEFLLASDRQFYFLEMNTRLQVEHPVTEMVTGLDLVELQLRVAMGEPLPIAQDDVHFNGHAVEARLYAEDDNFVPQVGPILKWRPPADVRVDHGLREGFVVTSDYDAMLAKLIVHAPTRTEALQRMTAALEQLLIHGVVTNRDFLIRLLHEESVRAGTATTKSIDAMLARGSDTTPSSRLIAVIGALLAGRPAIGFRVHGSATDVIRFELGGNAYVATVTGSRVNDTHSVVIADELAIVDGIEERLIVTRDGDCLYLTFGTATVVAKRLPLTEPKRAKVAAASRIVAPMNGKVISVAVRDGDRVAANALLLVLEAMKMQLEIRAPQASIVRAVRASAGAQVAPKAVLVELEPQES
jgi:geranyl-CoA carboxylase alpha subunit